MQSEKQDVEKGSAPKTEPEHADHAATGKANSEPDWTRLLEYARHSVDENPHFMDFRLLQRLNIVEIQHDLVKRAAAAEEGRDPFGTEKESLRKCLHDYATALRDYDYMRKKDRCSSKEEARHRDGFAKAFFEFRDVTMVYRSLENDGSLDILRKALRIHLPLWLSYDRREKLDRVEGYYIHRESPNIISAFVDALARFIIAFVTGVSLIIPMIIMSLDKSLAKSLVTTSVALFLFAVFASMVEAQNSEIVAATAAYAAVLVVFVGVSGP